MPESLALSRLVTAVWRAVQEHGLPNGFGLGELNHVHGGPVARQAGLVLVEQRAELAERLADLGIRLDSYTEPRREQGIRFPGTLRVSALPSSSTEAPTHA